MKGSRRTKFNASMRKSRLHPEISAAYVNNLRAIMR
jgi:hypothetical protein